MPRGRATLGGDAWPIAWGMGAGFVAAAGVSQRSLWQDEAITAGLAHGDVGGLMDGVVADRGNMALYYTVEHLLAPISSSDVWLRAPSVVSFGILVGLLWALTSRISGAKCAHATAALAVTSVALVYYGQEARSYAATAAVAVALVWSLDLALQASGRRRWATVVALSVVGVYLHVVMLLFLPAVFVVGYWRSPPDQRPRVLRSAVAVALACFPMIVGIAVGGDEQVAWLPSLGLAEVAKIGVALTGSHFGDEGLIVAGALALIIATAALVGGGRVVAGAARGVDSPRDRTPAISPLDVAVVGILSPLGLMLVASVFSPLTAPRYYLHLVPFVLYLAAIGTLSVKRSAWGVGILLTMVLTGAVRLVATRDLEDVPWRELAEHVESTASEGDIVHALPYWERAPFDWYHWRDGEALLLGLPPLEVLDLPQHPYPDESTGRPARGTTMFVIEAGGEFAEVEQFLDRLGVSFTVVDIVSFGDAIVARVRLS